MQPSKDWHCYNFAALKTPATSGTGAQGARWPIDPLHRHKRGRRDLRSALGSTSHQQSTSSPLSLRECSGGRRTWVDRWWLFLSPADARSPLIILTFVPFSGG